MNNSLFEFYGILTQKKKEIMFRKFLKNDRKEGYIPIHKE